MSEQKEEMKKMNAMVVSGQRTGKRMSSLEVAELMGKQHKHVMRDIKVMRDQGAITQSNFGPSEYKDASGRMNPMYLLDFTATMTLITGYDAKRRAMVVNRWHELETQVAAAVPALPINYKQALLQLVTQVEQNERLREESEAKQQVIADLAPKARFADAVACSKTSILIAALAKILSQNGIKIGQTRLFDWMREKGYLMKRGRDNMPTQRAMELGLFQVVERTIGNPNGTVLLRMTTMVTGKGQLYFLNKLIKEWERAA